MGQLTINREAAECVLANADADPGSRLIAALSIALFEAKDSAIDAGPRELSIARKMAHMIACEIYEGLEAHS